MLHLICSLSVGKCDWRIQINNSNVCIGLCDIRIQMRRIHSWDERSEGNKISILSPSGDLHLWTDSELTGTNPQLLNAHIPMATLSTSKAPLSLSLSLSLHLSFCLWRCSLSFLLFISQEIWKCSMRAAEGTFQFHLDLVLMKSSLSSRLPGPVFYLSFIEVLCDSS